MDTGATIRHYTIIRTLGKGGMVEVFLADDLELKRQVALKILPEAVRRDAMRLARFRTEAESAAKLKHLDIAQIYSIEEADGHQVITMEYIDSNPLNDLIPPDMACL